MVRLQQYLLILALTGGLAPAADPPKPRFYPDDPVQVVPPFADVTEPRARSIDAFFDFVYQSVRPDPRPPVPAQAINTLGEVPDSAWYTNRHARRRMSLEELRRGPGDSNAPVPPFEVISGKTEGITPGFTMRDAKGRVYFVKPDPPSNHEMATAADVIGARFFWALGYFTPENYILNVSLEDLGIGGDARIRGRSGRRRALIPSDLGAILDKVPRSRDGRLRFIASLRLEGKAIGPFRYEGTRSDDPNDIVPHELRRDLRGLHVFAAWLNHTDAKAGNSLDTVVTEDGRTFIRHHLIDFGAMLGSDSDRPKNARYGHEFMIPKPGEALRKIVSFGIPVEPWESVHYPEMEAAGRFDGSLFDPEAWKSNYPNPAFLSRLPDDEFWAAKQVMAFTDEEILALVETGEYSDPAVPRYLARALAQRRDKIGRTYFEKVLPLDRFRIEDSELRFDDLRAVYRFGEPRRYEIAWSRFDNQTSRTETLPGETAFTLPRDWAQAPRSTYFLATIRTPRDTRKTVRVYLRKGVSPEVAGIERTW